MRKQSSIIPGQRLKKGRIRLFFSLSLYAGIVSGAQGANWVNTDPNGGAWETANNWSITSPLAGDFDQNTVVDGRDFLLWERGAGTTYDQDDLADWEANYGMSGANVSPGPLDTSGCGVAGACPQGDAFINNGGTANFDSVADFSQHGRRIEVSDGTVNHVAGNFFPLTWIDLGTVQGKTGYFNVSSGALLAPGEGNLRIGLDDPNPAVGQGQPGSGNGVFTTSGIVSLPGEAIIGFNGTGTGTLNVNGGTFDSSILKLGFEGDGTGIVNQTAGTVTANLWVDLASNATHPNTSGTYNLSGGLLVSKAGDGILVGNVGTGQFNQTGGQVDAYKDLRLGHGNGGSGTYTQDDGTVNVGKRLRIGQANGGTGVYNLNGGTLNITSVAGSTPEWIEVGGGEGSPGPPSTGMGTFSITGGTLNNPGSLRIGLEGTGVVNQTGGTVNTGTTSGNISLANSGGSGTYNLQGGVLNASGGVIEAGFAGSDFNFTGGKLMNVGSFGGTLEQEGGILAPGASPGTMSIDNDYLLSSGIYQVEIDAISNDLLDVGVNVDLDADLNGADTTLAVELLGGYSPMLGETFTVIVSDATVSGTFASLDTSLATLGAGLAWDVVYNDQSVVLEVISNPLAAAGAAVPEPASGVLMLLGVGVGLMRRRRKQT